MSSAFLISFLIAIISISNGEIVNATTSDSTGEYYIANQNNTLYQKEIQCSSNVACYIECDIEGSCFNLTVNCGTSPICDIQCSGRYSCEYISIYISPGNTTLSCLDWYACHGIVTLYNDYTNYPSSRTILSCVGGFDSCGDITIKDATTKEDNYEELIIDRFKVYCDICSWDADGVTNLITIPSVVNETGEYYYDTGSLVNIECNTDKLCHIDCNNGGCTHSTIDCGPAEECTILCEKDTSCQYTDVKAVGMSQFNYICSTSLEFTRCGKKSEFNLTNIDTVNITCAETLSCSRSDYNIKSVRDLNVFCDFYWSCDVSNWWLTDVDNAVIICDASCLSTEWELNNVGYQYFDCIGDVTNKWSLTDMEACNDIVINGQETSQLDMFCENKYSCQDITICTDNIFNLDCAGSKSCNPLNICDDTLQSNKTNIIEPPTDQPTQYPTTAQPTTAKPTTNPTTAEPTQDPTTAKPTQDPTTAEPTAPTSSPTTTQPTAPTSEPSEEPTKLNIPIDSNGGNRIFGLFWMILVIFVIDFVQIM